MSKLSDLKLVMEYASDQVTFWNDKGLSYMEQHEEAVKNYKLARRFYVNELNMFIEEKYGRNVIVFDVPSL